MLATFAISCALMTAAPSMPVQQPNAASKLVSKMLQYYADAKTMSGTITYTATDGAGQAQLITTLQYEKPSKLFIRQVKKGNNPMQWLVTSDGKLFSYDAPGHMPGGQRGGSLVSNTPGSRTERLVERVLQVVPGEFEGRVPKMADYTVAQIYAVAASGSLGDRSVPLDIAIGRREDLKHDVLTWMTLESSGKGKMNGVEANLITGNWRPYGEAATDPNPQRAPGRFELYITDDGQLVRYVIIRLMGEAGSQPIKLQESWDVDLTMNGKVDETLFKVVK